ncbi:MAG: PEP-utilizing enzyme [Planctomycetota bacterium]
MRSAGLLIAPLASSGADPSQQEASVSRLAALGLPVPPGFRIFPREAGSPDEVDVAGFRPSLEQALHQLERQTGAILGDRTRPLFLSLFREEDRGGEELCFGLSRITLDGLTRRTGQPLHTFESLSRLTAHLGVAAKGLPEGLFKKVRAEELGRPGSGLDRARRAALRSQELYEACTAEPFPTDAAQQLLLELAARGRRGKGPPRDAPLLIHASVFGNAGGRSGVGMLSTRDPVSGVSKGRIDYLPNATWSEFRSGVRSTVSEERLGIELPGIRAALDRARPELERCFHNMMEAEFVVEDGHLWFLRARAGRRSARASLRIALDMVDEGRLDRLAALDLLRDVRLERLRGDRIAADELVRPLLTALPVAAGAASGRLALSGESARAFHAAGFDVVLFREEKDLGDLFGLAVSRGAILLGGGPASRTAAMSRRLGIPCVVGGSDLAVDCRAALLHLGGQPIREGDELTIDGQSGRIYAGRLPVREAAVPDELVHVRRWIFEAGQLDHPLG